MARWEPPRKDPATPVSREGIGKAPMFLAMAGASLAILPMVQLPEIIIPTLPWAKAFSSAASFQVLAAAVEDPWSSARMRSSSPFRWVVIGLMPATLNRALLYTIERTRAYHGTPYTLPWSAPD